MAKEGYMKKLKQELNDLMSRSSSFVGTDEGIIDSFKQDLNYSPPMADGYSNTPALKHDEILAERLKKTNDNGLILTLVDVALKNGSPAALDFAYKALKKADTLKSHPKEIAKRAIQLGDAYEKKGFGGKNLTLAKEMYTFAKKEIKKFERESDKYD